MLVDWLSLIVIPGVFPPMLANHGTGEVICLKAQVELILPLGLGQVTSTPVTEHEVIVGRKIFQIDL